MRAKEGLAVRASEKRLGRPKGKLGALKLDRREPQLNCANNEMSLLEEVAG